MFNYLRQFVQRLKRQEHTVPEDELRKAISLGDTRFLGFCGSVAVFVCVDIRANVHIMEVDRRWMLTMGEQASYNMLSHAVRTACANLSKARRN